MIFSRNFAKIFQNDISKFYDTTNNKAWDLGTDGTGSGLDQPRIFHRGNTSTFTTNNGTDSYTLSTVGTGTITDATGPEYNDPPPTGLRALDRVSLKAADSGITTQPASATGQITAAFWFKWDSGDTGNITMFNINQGSSAGVGNGLIFCEMYRGRYRFGVRDSGNNFRCDFVYSENSNNPETAYGNGLWDGEFHHFVVSCTTSDPGIEFYVDGVDKSSSILELSGRITAGNRSEFNQYDNVNLLIQWNDAGPDGGHMTQLWIDDSAVSLSTNISKFYDGGAVDMGSDGTGSGLSQPLIFHTGYTSDFFNKGGDTATFDYTVSSSGSGSDVSADDGPQFG